MDELQKLIGGLINETQQAILSLRVGMIQPDSTKFGVGLSQFKEAMVSGLVAGLDELTGYLPSATWDSLDTLLDGWQERLQEMPGCRFDTEDSGLALGWGFILARTQEILDTRP